MFDLADFYDYCETNEVDIIPYFDAPSEGTTIRDKDHYAIFLDLVLLRGSMRFFKGVCLHEAGHVATGALHKVDSPYETVERNEYRANRWAYERYLTVEDFREAFAAGYTELWQLADYFDLPEETIKNALSYWTERRGINFNES